MAVVINEFEVLSEPSQPSRQEAGAVSQNEGVQGEKLDTNGVLLALRQIELQALRVWSH
jgi:hypothetical protein